MYSTAKGWAAVRSTNNLGEVVAASWAFEGILPLASPLDLAYMAKHPLSFAGGAGSTVERRGSHAESSARLLVAPLKGSDSAKKAGNDVGIAACLRSQCVCEAVMLKCRTRGDLPKSGFLGRPAAGTAKARASLFDVCVRTEPMSIVEAPLPGVWSACKAGAPTSHQHDGHGGFFRCIW
jgi:hypothetical protein